MSAQRPSPTYSDLIAAMDAVTFREGPLDEVTRAILRALVADAMAAHPEHRTRERAGRNQSLRLEVERLQRLDPKATVSALAKRLSPKYSLTARQVRRVVNGA